MRKKQAIKRDIVPDHKYSSILVAKLIAKIMENGKKNTAKGIVYGAFDIIAQKSEKPPLEVFEKAIENIIPRFETKRRRVGGANYQVPVEVSEQRQISLSVTWLKAFARARNGKSAAHKLADEIWDAYNNTGKTVKKREETHKAAEANKAFAHYRWS